MRIVSSIALAMLASSGCATVLKSKKSSVMINSMAPGSAVLVDGQQVAVTPARIELSNKRDHTITVREPTGDRSCHVESRVSIGWVILGIVASPAWIVDLITGDWKSLDAGKCSAPL